MLFYSLSLNTQGNKVSFSKWAAYNVPKDAYRKETIMNKRNDQDSREIQIARIAFIGATIAAIGDGIAAYAAALTLDLLENPEIDTRSSQNINLEATQAQIDHYINELVQIRNSIK